MKRIEFAVKCHYKAPRLLIMTLLCSFLCHGCSVTPKPEAANTANTVDTADTVDYPGTSDSADTSDTETANVSSAEISLTPIPIIDIWSSLGRTDYFYEEQSALKYVGAEHYLTNDEIKFVIEVANMQPSPYPVFYRGSVDDLIPVIQQNSAEYKYDGAVNAFTSEYGDVVEEALRTALTAFLNTAQNNTQEDINTIREMKILIAEDLEKTGIRSGTFALTNQPLRVMFLNTTAISDMVTDERSLLDAFTYNISHELNHFRQSLSKEQRDMGHTIYSFAFRENTETLLTEASAESELYAYEKIDIGFNTYKREREAEAELFILSLPTASNRIDHYYNAIFDNNLNGLFRFYKLDDEYEISRFCRIQYAMNARLGLNDFGELFHDETVSDYPISELIGFEYKKELLLLFLNDLVPYVKDYKDVSLEEALVLYTVARSALCDDAYTIYMGMTYDEDLFLSIRNYEEKLYAFFAEVFPVSVDEVRQKEASSVYDIIDSMHVLVLEKPAEISDEPGMKKAWFLLEKYPVLRLILKGNGIDPRKYSKVLKDILSNG